MHDIRVLSSGDKCMTLSGHTSTLPSLVVPGPGFVLRWAKSQKYLQKVCFLTVAMIL